MLCNICNGKVKCIYSVPVEGVRYRVYRCKADDKYFESVEVPIEAIHKTDVILKRVSEGRNKRFGMIKAFNKGKKGGQ